MNTLKNRMSQYEDAERESGRRKKEKRREEHAAVYSADGTKSGAPFYKRHADIIILGCVLLLLLAVIYVPPLFYSDPAVQNSFALRTDTSAISAYQMYLKDRPEEDFDGDGLTNAMEADYGTGVWDPDTDGDGVNDYAELFITDTSPVETTDVLMGLIQDADDEAGDSLATPYKVDDVIYWPDSYFSKTFGGAVRTALGYRFCNYTGWVKFPQTVYAYGYDGEIHYELEHRENEDAWHIDGGGEVLLYSSPLKFGYRVSLPFGISFMAGDGFGGFLLDALLPEKGGIITCRREAEIDEFGISPEYVTAPLEFPNADVGNEDRFGMNMTSLSDLSDVRSLIDAGKCVAVSLYSADAGESVGCVYGYDATTNALLISDTDMNPVGTISVEERTMRRMNQDGEVERVFWYEWSGIGFSSLYGDRIAFIYQDGAYD